MLILIIAGFFIALFITCYLIFVPTNEYEPTPADLTLEVVRTRTEKLFISGDNDERLSIINKSPEEVMKLAVRIGLGFGLLTVIVAYIVQGYISILAILFGFVAMAVGVVITKFVIENEFKQWQIKLIDGVSPLTNFMPAFTEVKVLTTRECIENSLEFITKPFKGELETIIKKYARDGKIETALNNLAQKANHPIIDSVCFRLKMAWDSKVESDIFDDLSEELDDEKEKAATHKTVMKTALFAGIAIIAFLGAAPIYGYPALRYFSEQTTRGFGM